MPENTSVLAAGSRQEDQLAQTTPPPRDSGSHCPRALWGGHNCAIGCEGSSTPTPSDSPPLASHWSEQQVEQTRDTGKGQGSGQRLMLGARGEGQS